MGQGELPPPTDWSRTPTIEFAQSLPEGERRAADKFRLEGFEALPAAADRSDKTAGEPVRETGGDKGLKISNQGQIKEITLSGDWQEATTPGNQNVLRSERIFHPKTIQEQETRTANDDSGKKEANLVFFYSGRPNDEADGKAFRKALEAPPHKLSSDELKQLERTLGDLADKESFQLAEAATRDINGKRVLDIKGTWLYDRSQYHSVLIDGDGTGQVVQQMYLMAPASAFAKLDGNFESACSSIKWR